MTNVNTHSTCSAQALKSPRSMFYLGTLAAISGLAYILITLSAQSLYISQSGRHSLLYLLGLFGLACACYGLAIREALRLPQDRRLAGVIVAGALAFRLILLFSNPIEEIDIYRYLWDGEAAAAGVNPFRYSPQQVLAASPESDLPADLARLVARREGSPAMREILGRVHFGELPTIYPPVSQAVFLLGAAVTPSGSSVATRMTIFKALFVVCDLATMALVAGLLRRTAKPIGWLVAYAWCPLLLKEIANSGHLDALAILFTTLAVWLAVVGLQTAASPRHQGWLAIASAACLALAVGAKLYPVILAPWLCFRLLRQLGWRTTTLPAIAFAAITAAVTYPMWPSRNAPATALDCGCAEVISEDQPPLPPPEVSTEPRDPSESLRLFLSHWEMNDFFFMLTVENLRPRQGQERSKLAWFSVTPESWRKSLCDRTSRWLGTEPAYVPFYLARGLLSLVFVALALALAWSSAGKESIEHWLEAGFLTLVWFWLLLPTANPWYLTWALPLLPFVRNRAWLALSTVAFVYYLRFWFVHQFPDPMLGTNYAGPLFFDYVVTWMEFVPWLIWVAVEFVVATARQRSAVAEPGLDAPFLPELKG